VVRSRLCLVDLAGSEKWDTFRELSDVHLTELAAINSSLSSLGNCVAALAARRRHVPYRDSKLTRLLQPSLGGNARTLFLCTLSPSAACRAETLSTLQFAERAMRVEVATVPDRQLAPDADIEAHRREIARLRQL
ncbi:unnamed protein product, partial [Phaeothamnion confervicola]